MKIAKVLSQNITLAYEAMDLPNIDTRKLKGVLGTERQPTVMETPDTIVVVFPPEPTVIQLGQKRIRITVPESGGKVGDVPLWEIAVKCGELVSGSEHKLIAYGFNYELMALSETSSAHAATMRLFLPNSGAVEAILGGYLSSFTPRLKFQRGQTQYDLILEPLDEQQLKVFMNAHFEYPGVRLPTQDQLHEDFCKGYDYLVSVLPKLLAGDE